MESTYTSTINGMSSTLDEEVFGADEEIDEELDEETYSLFGPDDDEELWSERTPARRPLRPMRRARLNVPARQGTVSIPTQRGPVQAQLNESYVRTADFNAAIKKLEETSASNFTAVRADMVSRDQAIEASTKKALAAQTAALKKHAIALQRTERKLKKEIDDARQMSLISSLLNRTPEIKSLELTENNKPDAAKITYSASRTEYAAQNNLLPLLLMSGGLGGSSGGDSNNMMFLALALSGGL